MSEPRSTADLMATSREMFGRTPRRPTADRPTYEDLGLEPPMMTHEGRTSALWVQLIPERLVWAEVDHFDGEVAEDLAAWSRNPAGRNVVIFGPVGVGKSYAAVAAVRAAHHASLDVQFAPISEMLESLKPDRGMTWSDYAEVDRLIIDDIGSERLTEWGAEQLYLIINRRWLEARPTIVTSNLDPAALAELLGERMWSRLVGSDAVTLALTGEDRRRG